MSRDQSKFYNGFFNMEKSSDRSTFADQWKSENFLNFWIDHGFDSQLNNSK